MQGLPTASASGTQDALETSMVKGAIFICHFSERASVKRPAALSAAGQAKQPTTELQTFDALDSSSLSKNL